MHLMNLPESGWMGLEDSGRFRATAILALFNTVCLWLSCVNQIEKEAVLLKFYVGCDGRGYENLLIVSNFHRQDEQPPASPNHAGPGCQAPGRSRTQIVNRHIGGRGVFVEIELSDDRERRSRV